MLLCLMQRMQIMGSKFEKFDSESILYSRLSVIIKVMHNLRKFLCSSVMWKYNVCERSVLYILC